MLVGSVRSGLWVYLGQVRTCRQRWSFPIKEDWFRRLKPCLLTSISYRTSTRGAACGVIRISSSLQLTLPPWHTHLGGWAVPGHRWSWGADTELCSSSKMTLWLHVSLFSNSHLLLNHLPHPKSMKSPSKFLPRSAHAREVTAKDHHSRSGSMTNNLN
jgi:hypothetical protein